MKKLLWFGVLAAAALGCDPKLERVAPPVVVVARFDPSLVPPVVPTPNDLAADPATGRLKITPAPDASEADKEFYAYLNTLNGFPTGATATATFDGKLGSASVTDATVLVLDVDDGYRKVDGVRRAYEELSTAGAAAKVTAKPPVTGWKRGNRYAVAIVGGASGVKGADGQAVVASSTWKLARSKSSLVTCQDLSSADCRSVTEIIPTTKTEPAERVADQAAKAVSLEGLRRKYAPAVDAVIAAGVAREDIALLWTFRTTDDPQVVFNPSATPPQVPVPNDLAIDPLTGLVNAPIDPSAPEAQQEFTRDYLNTLDGFPVSATATASLLGADLDPASVTAQTVLLVNLTGGPAVTPTIGYDSDKRTVKVAPPATGWPKGARFAVAVLGGASGAKTSSGGTLVGSDVWALARSAASLVTCQDLADATCAPTITAAPLTKEEALKLEALRRGYAPVLVALEAQGVVRADVALLWTFRVVSQSEAVFDPAKSVIPFPNNLLLANGKVNLPIPPGATPAQQQLIGGLNTLDGFSTTAPSVSENSDALGATDVAALDAATLAAATGFVKLTPGGTPPKVKACLNCASSLLPDGGTPTSPPQLQFVPEVPLDEKATYAAFLSTALKDTRGKPVMASPTFALMRSKATLVDAGKSQVSGVSDLQAAALEPARLALKPLMDALELNGVPRKNVALTWAFTTQSAASVLKQLHALPQTINLPTAPAYLADVTTPTKAGSPFPTTNIGKVYVGTFTALFLLNGPGGTISTPPPAVTRRVPFMLTLPSAAAPSGGYPVAIWGHGLGSHHKTMLGMADALAAAGHALIAADVVFHGERSICHGAAAVLGTGATDDNACANPTTQKCDVATGRCVGRTAMGMVCNPTGTPPGDLACAAMGEGACVSDGAGGYACEGGDFLRNAQGAPVISGWNFLNTANLFATRDNFRQQVVDLAQLTRVIAGTSGTGLSALLVADGQGALDATQVDYAGQSLGGILGTLFTAASPTIRRSTLNVPGGDPAGILLTAPAFAAQRQAFIGTLAAQGITEGTPAFDNFIGIARWILDPADPRNAGYETSNGSTVPANRKVFIQYIDTDLVVPNATTDALIGAANRASTAKLAATHKFTTPLADLALADRHGFLINFKNPTVTGLAQQQVVTFFSTGVTP
ncbi:MAG: hypothetical protein HYZ28_19485 [Myxococcales bacterium]|nr:hypothetical protein [Myxococcales bacterium]